MKLSEMKDRSGNSTTFFRKLRYEFRRVSLSVSSIRMWRRWAYKILGWLAGAVSGSPRTVGWKVPRLFFYYPQRGKAIKPPWARWTVAGLLLSNRLIRVFRSQTQTESLGSDEFPLSNCKTGVEAAPGQTLIEPIMNTVIQGTSNMNMSLKPLSRRISRKRGQLVTSTHSA